MHLGLGWKIVLYKTENAFGKLLCIANLALVFAALMLIVLCRMVNLLPYSYVCLFLLAVFGELYALFTLQPHRFLDPCSTVKRYEPCIKPARWEGSRWRLNSQVTISTPLLMGESPDGLFDIVQRIPLLSFFLGGLSISEKVTCFHAPCTCTCP